MTLWYELIIVTVSCYLCHTCMYVCSCTCILHTHESHSTREVWVSVTVLVWISPCCHGTHVEAGGQLLGCGSYLPSCGFKSWWQAPLPTVLFWKPRNKMCYWTWSSLIAYTGWQMNFRDLPVSTPSKCWGYRLPLCQAPWLLHWWLGIHTQVLTLPIEPSPQFQKGKILTMTLVVTKNHLNDYKNQLWQNNTVLHEHVFTAAK